MTRFEAWKAFAAAQAIVGSLYARGASKRAFDKASKERDAAYQAYQAAKEAEREVVADEDSARLERIAG